MKLAKVTTTANTTIDTHLHLNARLYGRWLLAARATWVVLAFVIVVLNVLALPGVPAALTPQR